MKVSILIPVYNVEKYIRRCAESLFRQTYQNIEYIFIDDASSDNSIAILQGVLNEFPLRAIQTRIIHHSRNKGLAAARNTAIEAATGDYLYIVDSDDYIEVDSIELFAQNAIGTGSDIVTGNFIVHDDTDSHACLIKQYDNEDNVLNVLSLTYPHNVWNHLMKASLFRDYHIRAIDGVNYGEDHQIMVQAIYHAKKISFIENYTYHHDLTNEQSYINTFYKAISKEKSNQIMTTAQYIVQFFEHKEIEYKKKSKQLYFHYLFWVLSQLCIQGQRSIYLIEAKKINNVNHQYWTIREWFKPIFRIIVSSYYLMRCYLMFKQGIEVLKK